MAIIAARLVFRSAATSCRGATARISIGVKPRAASTPFRISAQDSLSARIFRSTVEMSRVSAVSMFPYHTVTASAVLTSMLSVASRGQAWNIEVGSCMPLADMQIGMQVNNIELRPGQGGKLVRAAGTSAKILAEPNRSIRYVEIKLPSGVKKLIDKRCRATIGMIANPEHGKKKLRKAGQSRWLGQRPSVRGVAMNPVDHPHGGGEGKSKSSGRLGKVSQTPWGKPTKGGYKTARPKRKI